MAHMIAIYEMTAEVLKNILVAVESATLPIDTRREI
jgi:hypothetical protein